MATGRIGSGGLPTEIDVTKLVDQFGVPARGTVFALADIAAVLGIAVGSSRFESVLGAYRRRLLKVHNLATRRAGGDRLEVLDEDARYLLREHQAGAALRRERNVGRDLAMIETDKFHDPALAKRRDGLLEFIADHFKVGARKYNALLPPAPPQALPRRSI